jgi:hypothetical protein
LARSNYKTSFSITCSASAIVRPKSRFSPTMPGVKGNRVKVPAFLILQGGSMGLARSKSGCGSFLTDSFIRVSSNAVRFQTRPKLVRVVPCLLEATIARQAIVRRRCGYPNWMEFPGATPSRMLKKSASREGDGPVSPLCSRNARSKKALVGRAQWGTHPGHPRENVHEQAWKDHLWSLAAALLGTRRVLARQGWAGEKVAFLSILRVCSPVVPHVRTIDVLACQHRFSGAC